MTRIVAALLLLLVAAVTPAVAHITPPVVLASDRETLRGLLAGASRFFVREVRLAPEERRTVQEKTGWAPDEDFYRFYVGRDGSGTLVAAATFLTEFTIHGPVRVAVAVGRDGRVKGARIVELTEETYVWVKPLIDGDFTRRFVGQAALPPGGPAAGQDPMTAFYGQVIAGLVQRAVALFDVVLARPGGAA
jgi:hypothetical protein